MSETNTGYQNGCTYGFSSKIYDSELQERAKKQHRLAFLMSMVLGVLSIGISIAVAISKDDGAIAAAGFLFGMILFIIGIVTAVKNKLRKQWDGEVVEQKTKIKTEHHSDHNSTKYTLYVTVFRDENGRKRVLKERTPNYYNYLNTGDRVRFHPQFYLFYEKYDKTKDTYLLCPICQKENDVSNSVCYACSAPLVK